jgi:hypothetical protein
MLECWDIEEYYFASGNSANSFGKIPFSHDYEFPHLKESLIHPNNPTIKRPNKKSTQLNNKNE